ncbi:uncharacterized protein LOC133636350 [Entelurus aequoreus]|uniref:uncharacterized protein LOC133636350 n=1 Tax=Entelurus aequoreus TaxID=161455 RepID=UPI002B1E423E|nr:uncharacterized protein LOC133636350 [Entelurus aequoreus]
MHVTSVRNEEVNAFTITRWDTYRNCLKRWLCCDGASHKVAETFTSCIHVELKDIPDDAGLHPTCYRRFIDKKRLDSAEKLANRLDVGQDECVASDNTSDSTSGIPKKKLRWKTGLPIAPCHLHHLQESGQENYCGRQTAEGPSFTDTNAFSRSEATFDASYNIFGERIFRQRIIVNQEVLRMKQLRPMFLNTVQKHEDCDASNYRQDQLKRRLTLDFPQLVFQAQHLRTGFC